MKPTAICAAASVIISLGGATACSADPVPALPTAFCAIAPDFSGSDEYLQPRVNASATNFLSEGNCATVQIVPISLNSAGEECGVPEVDMTDLVAAIDNPTARATEIQEVKLPQVTARVATLRRCIVEAGRTTGTDVVGAFTKTSRLANGKPVNLLVVSDMVHNVGMDWTGVGDTSAHDSLVTQLAGALPALTGWHVTVAGAGSGTEDLTPAQSDGLQAVWRDAVVQRGGMWEQEAI